MANPQGVYHVCHHEQVALSIISRSFEGIISERSALRVRMRFVAAAELPASSILEMWSCAKSKLRRLHFASCQ